MPIQSKGDRMAAGTALVAHLPDQALAGPLGSLDAYLERVSRIPVLSREEERALGERFRKSGDLAAARQLVLAHLRFVVHIARGYTGYGLPVGDLIQEGNVGRMKAVKRCDPALNVRRDSFPVTWPRALPAGSGCGSRRSGGGGRERRKFLGSAARRAEPSRCAQPRHRGEALDVRGQGHPAPARRPIRRLRGAHPPDRVERTRQASRAGRRLKIALRRGLALREPPAPGSVGRMRSVTDWLGEYGASHQNPTNKRLHWICVPPIVLSVMGFLWSAPVPSAFADASPWLNWATLAAAAAVVYCLVLSPALAVGVVLDFGVLHWSAHGLPHVPRRLG